MPHFLVFTPALAGRLSPFRQAHRTGGDEAITVRHGMLLWAAVASICRLDGAHYRMKTGVNYAAIERAKRIDAAAFLQSRGLLTKRASGDWAAIRCPVHKQGQEQHQSMRVNLRDGHYRCMVCVDADRKLTSQKR